MSCEKTNTRSVHSRVYLLYVHYTHHEKNKKRNNNLKTRTTHTDTHTIAPLVYLLHHPFCCYLFIIIWYNNYEYHHSIRLLSFVIIHGFIQLLIASAADYSSVSASLITLHWHLTYNDIIRQSPQTMPCRVRFAETRNTQLQQQLWNRGKKTMGRTHHPSRIVIVSCWLINHRSTLTRSRVFVNVFIVTAGHGARFTRQDNIRQYEKELDTHTHTIQISFFSF